MQTRARTRCCRSICVKTQFSNIEGHMKWSYATFGSRIIMVKLQGSNISHGRVIDRELAVEEGKTRNWRRIFFISTLLLAMPHNFCLVRLSWLAPCIILIDVFDVQIWTVACHAALSFTCFRGHFTKRNSAREICVRRRCELFSSC